MSSCKLRRLISQASGKGLSSREGFFFSWEFGKDFAMRQLCWFTINCRQPRNACRVCKVYCMYSFYIKNAALETRTGARVLHLPFTLVFCSFFSSLKSLKQIMDLALTNTFLRIVNYIQEPTDLAPQETSQRSQLLGRWWRWGWRWGWGWWWWGWWW